MAVPITTGLQLHLDAEAITGLTDGDRVSQWDDSSSNTNHAAQNTEVDQPTYKVNVINGKPVVRFTSATEFLVVSNHASINIADNNITMFVVFAFANKRDSATSFREDIINKYRNYSLEAGANSGSIVSAFRSGSWRWYATTKNSWNANQFYILTNRRDRTNTAAHFYVDNSLDSSHSLYNGDADATYDLLIGSGNDYNTPSNYLQGDIAEILIYDRVLSDTERDDVEQYLHSKWLAEPSNNAEVDIINTGQAIEVTAGVDAQAEVDIINTGQVLDSEITVEGKAEVDITNAGQVIESEAKVTDKAQLDIINDDQTVESNAAVKVKTDIDLANSGQGIDVDANVEPEGGVWVDIINDYQEVNSEADVYLSANADIVNGGQGVDVVGSIKVHSEVDISNDSQQVAVNVEPIITIEVDVINSDQVTESNATVEIDTEVNVVNLDQELSGNIKGRPGLDVDIINHGQTLEVNAESLLFTEIGIINDDQGLEIQAGVIYDANINLFNEPQEIVAEAKVRAKLEAGLINEDQTFIAKLYEHILWDVYITVKPKGIELTATQVPTFTIESKNIRVKITS